MTTSQWTGAPHTKVPVLGKTKRQKVRQIRHSKGIPATVDAAIVQAHVEWLYSIGFNDNSIAAAAGISQRAVWLIRNGKHALTRIDQASRLLAVTHAPVEAQAGMIVPGLGVRRRFYALQAVGYAQRDIASLAGFSQSLVSEWGRAHTCRFETWRTVRDLYEAQSGTPGTNERARRLAARNGVAPPLAWEGVDIDHPDSTPILDVETAEAAIDEVLLQRIIDGRHVGEVRGPERKAVIDHAIERGWNRERLSQSLNISIDGADMALVRRRRELRKQAA